jgi:diaminopimelate epimerase
MQAVHLKRSQMRSSRWQAQGNVYLIADAPLTAEGVRAEVGDADGILEVRDSGDDWIEIAIWNPDGSLAEMSGNGTRIAARWLAERTGARDITVRVGPREVRSRMLEDGLVEQILGPVEVGEPDEVEGIRFTPVDVGNPHAVVEGDPAELDRIGPLLETHPRFPNRTNVQVARRLDGSTIEARVWERGVGETGASGTSAIAVAAALGADAVTVRFPGGDLHVRLESPTARLTGPAEEVNEDQAKGSIVR